MFINSGVGKLHPTSNMLSSKGFFAARVTGNKLETNKFFVCRHVLLESRQTFSLS